MEASTVKPLLLSSAAQNASAHTLRQHYIILHPNNLQLPYVSLAARTRVLNATRSITFADLTAPQAEAIKNIITPLQGHIELNQEHKLNLPQGVPVAEEAAEATEATEEVEEATAAKKNPYAKAPVTCPKTTISPNIVLFFPDAMVDKTLFPKVNLSFGNNYSGTPTACGTHGNYTLSIYEQVLGDPNMSVTNIPVFTCAGTVIDESSISALMDILDYQKANPTQKVAVYFAVDPSLPNAALTAVTQECVAAGILLGLAAGNDGENWCNANFPPQSVAGTLQTGATQSPGDQCPWWSNWSDITPGSQYGDCVQAYLPGDFTSKKFKVQLKGTSGTIPQGIAWAVRWWNENPTATAADVIQAFVNHTVVITKPANCKPTPCPPYTPSGEFRVVKTADYCNTKVSSTPKPS